MAAKDIYIELKDLEQRLQESHQKETQIIQAINTIKETMSSTPELVKNELKKIFQKING